MNRMKRRMPEKMEIMHRISKKHPGFRHIINSKTGVVLVRGSAEEEEELMRTPKHLHKHPTSQTVLQGIIDNLIEHEKIGLIRYVPKGETDMYAALCIPPTKDMLIELRIPWRMRELIQHDTLIVVIGKKVSSQKLREAYDLPPKVKTAKSGIPKLRSVAQKSGVAAKGIAKKKIGGAAATDAAKKEKNSADPMDFEPAADATDAAKKGKNSTDPMDLEPAAAGDTKNNKSAEPMSKALAAAAKITSVAVKTGEAAGGIAKESKRNETEANKSVGESTSEMIPASRSGTENQR